MVTEHSEEIVRKSGWFSTSRSGSGINNGSYLGGSNSLESSDDTVGRRCWRVAAVIGNEVNVRYYPHGKSDGNLTAVAEANAE